ncbi:MAG TPA: nucleotide exchange factor GrpE [Thermoplasmata archaeon]|nr:nucleotide exchange factor GrpE [Thermoplasmata archaeon]
MTEERTEGPVPTGTAPAEAGATPPAEPVEDWATRYKYLLADFENYRRRSERDRESVTRQSRGAMLRELLPILEAFQAARQAAERLPASDPLRQGFTLLDREWMTFLKHEGVEPVARVGEPFHAHESEAVGEAPPRPEAPGGSIVEVVQQGYRFFGGLLRPAKVIVARAPASPDDPRPGDATAVASSEEKP